MNILKNKKFLLISAWVLFLGSVYGTADAIRQMCQRSCRPDLYLNPSIYSTAWLSILMMSGLLVIPVAFFAILKDKPWGRTLLMPYLLVGLFMLSILTLMILVSIPMLLTK